MQSSVSYTCGVGNRCHGRRQHTVNADGDPADGELELLRVGWRALKRSQVPGASRGSMRASTSLVAICDDCIKSGKSSLPGCFRAYVAMKCSLLTGYDLRLQVYREHEAAAGFTAAVQWW